MDGMIDSGIKMYGTLISKEREGNEASKKGRRMKGLGLIF